MQLLYVCFICCRIVDQLYALQLVQRPNGTSGYTIGVPVGFEREGRVFIFNHYRIIVHYHSDTEDKQTTSVGGRSSSFDALSVQLRDLRRHPSKCSWALVAAS